MSAPHPEATVFAPMTFSERQACAQPGSTAKPEPISSDVFNLRAWEHPLSRTASTLATITQRLFNPGGDAANVTLHLLLDISVKPLPARVTAEGRDRCGEVMTSAMFALHSQVLECGWAALKQTQRDTAATKLLLDHTDESGGLKTSSTERKQA